MESGEQLASPSSTQSSHHMASSSASSSPAPAPAPPHMSSESRSLAPGPVGSPITSCGQLFQIGGDQHFSMSGLSGAFPLLSHPAFGLYSVNSGRSEFGGLGSLGLPAALASHPQLGTLPDWWRATEAHARGAASLFPPLLHLPPIFAPSFQTHNATPCPLQTPGKNRRAPAKGVNGTVKGASISPSSAVDYGNVAPFQAKLSVDRTKATNSSRGHKSSLDLNQVQQPTIQNASEKGLNKSQNALDTSSMSGSQSGSSVSSSDCDVSSDLDDLEDIDEDDGDLTNDSEDSEESRLKTELKELTPAESQMKRSAERVNVHPSASHLPLLSFQPTSHTSVIQATGSAAGNKPLATAAHPHREASVLPLKASPKALPLSSSSPKHFTPSASPKHFSYTSSPKRSSVSPLPLSLCASSMPPALSPLHKPKSSTPSPGRTQPGDSRNLNKISLQPHAFKLKQPFLPQDSFTPSFSPSPPKNQDVNKSLIKSPPRSSLLPPAKLSREAAPPLHGNHTNLFLSQSPNGVRMPGALQDVQDSPLALVTRPRGQSRVPSGKPPFSLPVNLSTGGKFAVAQSTSTSLAPTSAAHRPRMNKTSKAFRAGMGSSKTALSIPLEDPVKSTESDNPSSKDSDDSTGDEEEEEDDDDDDDSDGSLSESESNLESDSDCSMDDTKEHDETETDTEAEKALPKLSKEAFSFHDPARLSPVNLQVAKPGVLPGSLPAPVGANSSAALTFCCSPPASFTPAGNAKWRRVTDEQELRLPLQLGWQRETRIRTVAGRLQGEVAYYAPCGKKLRQYPDVMKYISRNGITKISRDNFSFSTKIKVGDFYEAREGPEGLQWSLLKEEDVLARIIAMDGRRSRHSKPEPQRTGDGSKSRKECPPCVSEPVVQDASEAKLQRKLKAQEIARQAAEIKMMRKLEKQEMARAAKEVRRQQAMMAAEERRKKKEEMKILKQQEKIKRIQQIRKEKELRAQQILEAKRKKKEEAANAKIVETEKRRKEKEMRRHQAVLLKHQELEKHRLDMERERRRQHLMLMKAMEARKKAEERERLKQEKKDEKRLNKERKLELRRLELEIAKELKKPNEDMCLADHKELPELSRIPGLFLPGGTFSDCLMVMQFLHSFGKVLGFDINAQVPDLHVLQKGLLNMGDSMGRVQDLLVCMLSKAVCDPGLPPGHKRKTALGDHLANVGINRDNVSEVLQLFMEAHCRHSELAELALSLKTNAFQAHKPSQKASILAFLVNELCCSKAVVSEIDKNIDYMTNLRKDKWVVEGKLRNLRSVYAKRTGGRDGTAGAEDGHTPGTPSTGRKRKRKEGDSEEEEDEDDDSEEQADDDDDDEEEAGGSGAGRKGKKVEICEEEDDGDQAVSVEELEKQIEKTSKQQTQIRRKLFESTSFLRSMVYGQDRYKRRYWVLPQCGGIFVEGMESAEVPEELEKERQRRGPPDGIRVKEEQPAVPSPTQSSDQDSVKDDFNLFLQKPGSFSKLSKLLEATKMSPDSGNNHLNNHPAKSSAESSPSYLPTQSAVSHAPSAPAPLGVSHLSCSPHARAPGPSDHFLRALTEKSGHWFSLLPRSPCDDSSFTSSSSPQASCSSPRSSSTTTTSRPKSPPSLSPNPLESAGINNLQLSSPQREVKPGVAQAGPPLCGWLSGAPSPNRPFPGSAPSPTLAPAYQLSEANGSSNPFLAHSAPSRRSETPDPPTDKPAGAPSPTVELSKNQDYIHPQPIPEEMMCGWWRVSGMEQLQTLVKALHSRGIREKALQKQIQKHMEYLGQACAKRKDVAVIDAAELEYLQVSEDTVESWCVEEQAMEVDIGLLQQVEELERRVALASLQIKGWMRPKPQSEREDLVYHEHKPFSALGPERGRHGSVERHPTNPLDIAVARLGELEQNIERRYLKSPLSTTIQIRLDHVGAVTAPSTRGNGDRDEDPPPGMRLWRKALGEVRSSAQLSLCLQQLQKSIAWERSIMKAYCQLCQKGDNAELLLLCDGCDKGCHTYCHKPKITTIPEGDWFCPSCIAKVSGRSPQSKKQQSRTAGGGTRSSEVKRNRRLVAVGELYEEGPASPSSTSGTSTSSSSGGSSRSSKKGSRDSKKRKAGESSPENQPKEESPVCCVKKPKTAKDNTTKDLAMCRVLLVDLESHQDAWPFLTPVNHKDVPGYKKVIKRPMDFSTIREKLLTNQYVTLEMFIIDVNLVFDNCEKFNEDNSDIGRAGHSMRKFFEKRWTDLLKETF